MRGIDGAGYCAVLDKGKRMMDFVDFARANGLLVDHAVPDGKWHRVPTTTHPRKRNGSFKLLQGIGWAIDFASMQSPARWMPNGDETAPVIDWTAVIKHEAEIRAAQIQATQKAREFYRGCKMLTGSHPYLDAHGLKMDGCYGLKLDRDGWMVVPMFRDKNLMSVQRISPGGEKKFWYKAPARGTYYRVDRPGATVTVICEGLATGLAIFAAVPVAQIIVAFTAAGLGMVPKPRGLAVIAADNDSGTEEKIGTNPGIKAATDAAAALGCGVAIPTCSGSDWCDWRNETRARRIESRRKNEREASILRAVDADLSFHILRHVRMVHA